jgi:hypothetical protein
MTREQDEQFTPEEAQRRFEATLRGAVNTPPTPLKDMPKTRAKKQSAPPNNKPKARRRDDS